MIHLYAQKYLILRLAVEEGGWYLLHVNLHVHLEKNIIELSFFLNCFFQYFSSSSRCYWLLLVVQKMASK